jgi:hypothetical protein
VAAVYIPAIFLGFFSWTGGLHPAKSAGRSNGGPAGETNESGDCGVAHRQDVGVEQIAQRWRVHAGLQ